jgi:hypothetical protein
VQELVVASATPVQLVLATTLPPPSWQVTDRVALPEFTACVQVPVRVCARWVVQDEPAAGVQAE